MCLGCIPMFARLHPTATSQWLDRWRSSHGMPMSVPLSIRAGDFHSRKRCKWYAPFRNLFGPSSAYSCIIVKRHELCPSPYDGTSNIGDTSEYPITVSINKDIDYGMQPWRSTPDPEGRWSPTSKASGLNTWLGTNICHGTAELPTPMKCVTRYAPSAYSLPEHSELRSDVFDNVISRTWPNISSSRLCQCQLVVSRREGFMNVWWLSLL